MKKILVTATVLMAAYTVHAQSTEEKEAAYKKTIRQRAEKIVDKLGLADGQKASRVAAVIAGQYNNLNNIYNSRDAAKETAKQNAGGNKPSDETLKAIDSIAGTSVDSLHGIYIALLAKELNEEQVEQVKDGMTYGVAPLTYNGYLAMIERLTDEQKRQVKAWLLEAREHAMDAESSEKKHAWFGKYKGRINNYLSKQGYDMKKESEAWAQRVKEKEQKQQ